MSSIPRISRSIFAHWTDNAYFHRGQKYYEQGAIYEQRIQGMSINRDRGNYSQAAFCLREIRNFSRQLNEIQLWDKLIAEIRERFRKLPAFQDELNQLKL